MERFKKTAALLIFILYISASSALCYDTTFILGSLFLLGVWALGKEFRVDRIILIVTGYFILIDLFSSIHTDDPFRITRVFNYLYPIFISYFCLKICRRETIPLLERIVYVLTIVSLVLFAVQWIAPAFFDRLSPYLGSFLAEPYLKKDPTAWYAFVYRYMPIDQFSGMVRNSGFMWEPGAFAWISVIMLFYRWFAYGIRLRDRHVLVYIAAIASTFSTAGYLALICAGILYVMQLKSTLLRFSFLVLLILVVPVIYNLDFMSGKIDSYFAAADQGVYGFHEETNTVEFNRYMFFVYVWGQIMAFPLGYGTHDILTPWGDSLISPNGLAKIMYHWGLVGVFFLIYALYRFFDRMGNLGRFARLIATLSVCIPLFSNPAHANPLVFLLVLYPFIYKKPAQCESPYCAAIRFPTV